MRIIRLIAAVLLAFLALPALAVTCTAVASAAWNLTSTWTGCTGGNGVPANTPGSNDTAIIASGRVVSLSANAAAAAVTTSNPTSNNGLTLNGYTLSVGGAVTMTRPTNSASSTINVGTGTLNAGSITINGGSNGNRVALLTVSSGSINVSGNLTFANTAAQARLTSTGASNINVGGNLTSGGTLTTNGTGTITFNGSVAQSIGAYTTYNNVVINKSAGAASLLGTTTIGGTLGVSAGTLTVGGVTLAVNGATGVAGTLNITGTGGTKTFAGLVSINSGGIWNNSANEAVAFQGGIAYTGASFVAGTAVQTFNVNNQAISGTLTIPSITVTGVTLSNNGNLTVSTALAGTGTLVNSAAATLNLGGTSSITVLTANAIGNTVNYDRAAAQTIMATPYYNLTLSGSGAKTAAGALTVNGDLTLAGSATFTAGAYTHNFLGNWIVNTSAGTPVSAAGSTLNFNAPASPAATSVGGTSTATLALNNVNINNPSGVSLNENLSAAGTLTVASTLAPAAAVVVSGSGTLTGSGTVLVTRTAATADFNSQYSIAIKTLANLTVVYQGAAAQIVSAQTYGGLTINNAGGATMGGNATVNGSLTLTSGTLAVAGYTLTLNGPAIAGTATNLTTTGSSSLSFGGSSSGVTVPTSVTQLANLTVNNGSGVGVGGNLATGTLTLTSGAINPGNYTLSVTGNCPGSVSRNAGFVDGKLQLSFPSGTTTCTYDVGSGSTYAPIGLNMVTTTLGGGTLTASTTGNEQPEIASSGIDPTNDANRYWSLWASGDTISASSYGATFNFVTGDLDISATATSFVVGRYVSATSTWSLPTPVTATATSTGVSSMAGPIDATTGTISFAVGDGIPVCSVPAGMPAGTTCVCDNFGRTTLNPSTIYGGNWILSQQNSGSSFGLPRIVNPGYLRMTDNSTGVATAATLPGTFPAAGNWVTVEFKHYSYNGTGADGMALTLSDATVNPVPGAFGGSLGYAQKSNPGSDCTTPGGCPGFAGGWIGVGLDEYGNYSNPTEGRIGGPGLTPGAVAVRGSGSGQTGYPYLAGTGTLSPAIDSPSSTSAAPGDDYRISVDARNYTASNHVAQVTVNRDTTGTGNYTSANQIVNFDAYQANSAQAPVPANWVLSFTGSTGASVDIHELGGIRVCAQTYVPPAGYRIQVDNFSPSTCTTAANGMPIVTVSALDTNGNIITTYNKTVVLSALLAGGGASSANWSIQSANGTLGGSSGGLASYTFVAADQGVAKFYLTDATAQSVYISVGESGGTLSSSLATPVQYSGGGFNVANIDALAANAGGGVVAGRPHLMSITATSACGTNTAYTGTKTLDGWYNPAVGDHPNGAAAPQICTTNSGGTCLPATGASCAVLSIAPPALSASSNNLPPLSFASGTANFCLVTSDVGKYSLGLRDDSNVSSPITGYSQTLTVRPFAVVVSNVQQGGTANPANSNYGGSVFAKAGTAFQAKVAGYLWNAVADTGNNGLPGPNATFSDITGAGITPSYADSVVLSAAAPTPNSYLGSLGNGTVAVTGGSATPNTLTYSEVGSFSLNALPSASYLNTAGVDLGTRAVVFANPASNSRTAWVGRFIPDHFALSGGAIVNRSDIGAGSGCSPASTFSYMDEPFTLGFTLTAQNYGNATTRNYQGSWAALAPTDAWTSLGSNRSFGLGAINIAGAVKTPLSARLALFNPTANPPTDTGWNVAGAEGSDTFAAQVKLARAAAPDGPYAALNLGLAPQDGDGVTLLASSLNLDADNNGSFERYSLGTTQALFGRLQLASAYGSELLPIRVPVTAQYFTGTAGTTPLFATNTLDSCTAIPANTVAVGCGALATGQCLSALPTPGAVALSGGIGQMILSAPGAGYQGAVNVAVNLGATAADANCIGSGFPAAAAGGNTPWLRANWGCLAGYNSDPNARASFGMPASPFIYLRENY